MSTATSVPSARPGPWARRARSAIRHPRRAFRESLAERRRSGAWALVLVPAAATALATLAAGDEGSFGVAAMTMVVGVPVTAFVTIVVATAAWALGRWVLGGTGSWHDLVRALLWSRLPLAETTAIAVPLIVAGGMLESDVAWSLALAALVVGAIAGWVLLVAFVADAHRFSVGRSLTLLLSLVLSALALGAGLVAWVDFSPRTLLAAVVVVLTALALAGTALVLAACVAAFRGSR